MKYIGVILFLVVVAAGFYAWTDFDQTRFIANSQKSSDTTVSTLIANTQIEEDKQAKVSNYLDQLTAIERFSAQNLPEGYLVAQAPAPKPIRKVSRTSDEGKNSHGESEPETPLYLTMVYISPSKRYASINDRLVLEGDMLEEGSKVVKIEPERVTLKKSDKTRVLSLARSE
ncbi:MAG: hypothetical protein RI556_01510 [Hydrogenovibrio sp.]|uniref:hypothetical protein n=1 Tax=Hydrogenovibrio sp. TaxID=2065821 RepID=UPI0028704473|nr:hypothetical protein [Hydrogenovibrio sp.]MDR9497825.1 hypothetical protein [Hydrogenovibrio sp.]